MNANTISTLTIVLGVFLTIPVLGIDRPTDNRVKQEKNRDSIRRVDVAEVGPARAGRFDLILFELTNNAWAGIRYNKLTGKSWIFAGEAWVAIKESNQWEKKSNSNFRIKAVKFGPAKDYVVMRLNVDTGESWRLKDGRWLTVTVFSSD